MHALIIIPYYFLGALAALPLLILVSRLLRVKLPINSLVGAAIGLSLAGIIIPLACDWVDLAAFSGRPMLALILLSFLFVAVDLLLAKHLPLPLDDELREL